jgi:predicted TIM-barrel fold metal-dependent hydrolase
MNNSITEIAAIDVHAHYGTFANAPHALVNRFRSGSADAVAERARAARTDITIVSPLQALMPRFDNDAEGGNDDAANTIAEYSALRFWVVLDPRKSRTFEQAERMLQLPHCAGIKIHPEEHGYPIRAHGSTLFSFAQQHGAAILTHSGEQNSLPEDFVPLANDFPDVRLILAHLGCGFDGDPTHQVRAIQSSRSDNVFVDTSSAQSLMPGLIEWAVGEIGAEKILYGTDAPLYCSSMQRARIDFADISDENKRLILRENALRLLTTLARESKPHQLQIQN